MESEINWHELLYFLCKPECYEHESVYNQSTKMYARWEDPHQYLFSNLL